MNNISSAMVLCLAVSSQAIAATNKKVEDLYFSGDNPVLTAHEQAAIKLAETYRSDGAAAVKPWAGPDGSIMFLYGAQRVSVVCAVLQICDIALQPGESVTSINLGDTARWIVDPAIEGSGPGATQHLIIKPMDVGLETSLVVTTDRRTYHMELKSHRSQYMPQIAFAYPEVAQARWAALRNSEQKERIRNTIPTTGEYLGELDFTYQLEGDAAWKPVRVYNDGRKTVIQMPTAINQTEAPTLLVVRKQGHMFKDEETVMVNYRVQNDKYIVDAVFDRAILIAGVGDSQTKITIVRGES